MNDPWKGLCISRTALKLFGLACAFCLAFGGFALAQTRPPCATPANPGWTIDNPSLDDQRAIMDVLYGYGWTIDDRDASSFADLFAQPNSSYYELCNVTGSVIKLTLGKGGTDDLLAGMQTIAAGLESDQVQSRHLVTNTLFDKEDDKTVKTKSIVLVTVQTAGYPAPVLDYSADARATLVKGEDGNWKFQSLTVHADTSAALTKKR
jgi:hypothetical protein